MAVLLNWLVLLIEILHPDGITFFGLQNYMELILLMPGKIKNNKIDIVDILIGTGDETYLSLSLLKKYL